MILGCVLYLYLKVLINIGFSSISKKYNDTPRFSSKIELPHKIPLRKKGCRYELNYTIFIQLYPSSS